MARLSDNELAHYRARLETLRAELTERLQLTTASARPVDVGQPIGRLSRGDAFQAQQIAKDQRLREQALLQMIASALGRVRDATYGICLGCDEEIDRKRLDIAPESTQCLSCRRASEQ